MKQVPPAVQPYSAIVLGSTGNVGRQIVALLAASAAVTRIIAVNRRQTDEFTEQPKVREVVVSDLEQLAQTVERAARDAGATAGFCAIGVGKGSQKMPVAEVRKIEVRYPEAFAVGCRAAGVLSLGLLTAAGSDVNSSFNYVRIIGEKEHAVIRVGLPALGIYKPSVIFGNSNTPPYLHYLFPAVQWALPSRYHAIHKDELARAMIEGTQQSLGEQQQTGGGAHRTPEVRSYEYTAMKALLGKE